MREPRLDELVRRLRARLPIQHLRPARIAVKPDPHTFFQQPYQVVCVVRIVAVSHIHLVQVNALVLEYGDLLLAHALRRPCVRGDRHARRFLRPRSRAQDNLALRRYAAHIVGYLDNRSLDVRPFDALFDLANVQRRDVIRRRSPEYARNVTPCARRADDVHARTPRHLFDQPNVAPQVDSRHIYDAPQPLVIGRLQVAYPALNRPCAVNELRVYLLYPRRCNQHMLVRQRKP